MLILGISGGLDLLYRDRPFFFARNGWFHDAAAALVDNGRVVAAIEEERLNRIKHTSKAAVSAMQFCLNNVGARLKDIDRLAVYGKEEFLNDTLRNLYGGIVDAEPVMDIRSHIHEMLDQGLGEDITDDKILFVPHHLAHATSAYGQSGFDRSLVLTVDGAGDDLAGMVLQGEHGALIPIRSIPMDRSIGFFYLQVISFLGFGLFEEYKVMALAPYGDANQYRDLFKRFYDLLPNGEYRINWGFYDVLSTIAAPRKKKDPIAQAHKDIAAALQDAVEEIVFHILRFFQVQTNNNKLCMAGGVAHNCTLNGKILYSGMFTDVFVQPASHDAGCALGSALYSFLNFDPYNAPYNAPYDAKTSTISRLDHVYWGTDIGASQSILRPLNRWEEFLNVEYSENVQQQAANLLANGSVIGWVQGRSEFGPRALGNRSIVADPRPDENKDRINTMVKKREAFRPFAPSILEEYADEFFDLPQKSMAFPYMVFVVKARTDKRELMKATIHIDGSARVQTVSKTTNRRFWELIDAFREITGVPILLNTSFNNNVEPIVDSVEDAVVCFLTTELNYLVVGDYIVGKKQVSRASYLGLTPSLASYSTLIKAKRFVSDDEIVTECEITNAYSDKYSAQISSDMHALLSEADGKKTLGELRVNNNITDEEKQRGILDELAQLWSRRVIRLNP